MTDERGAATSAIQQAEELVVPRVLQSVARVRRFAVWACAAGNSAADVDTVALLVSEVATNALVHGSGEVRVRVVPRGGRVRVEVSDASPVGPVPRVAGLDSEGSRGLTLVAALAAAWGVEVGDDGKTVWFEVDG